MAAQAGLCETWSEIPKTGFLVTQLICLKWVELTFVIKVMTLQMLQYHLEEKCIMFVRKYICIIIMMVGHANLVIGMPNQVKHINSLRRIQMALLKFCYASRKSPCRLNYKLKNLIGCSI